MTADMLLPVVGASAVALRSVDLVVPDLTAARRFYTDVWGLTEVAGPEIVLRATGADHHVLVLHEGPPALHSITFRAPTQEAVGQAAQAATQTGARLLGEPGPVDWPGGGFGVAFVDPQGRTLRLVHGDATRTPDVPIVDRPTRLSHVNINSGDTDATARFFTEALGFRPTAPRSWRSSAATATTMPW
jgi:catechol 2,3-dioxygenase-like lactoylglutathione lyase family enzyme